MMTAATAPPACARRTLDSSEQVPPAVMRATRPSTLPIAVQPLVGLATRSCPVRLKRSGPKFASATPMPSPVGSMVIRRASWLLKTYICMRGEAPSDGVDMLALSRVPSSAASCASASSGSFSSPPRP
jgi:hypothetical protein